MSKNVVNDLYVLPPDANKTFSYDATLRSLPVPSLRHTLDKYVESIRPFVNADELKNTKRVIHEFENGIGKTLHAKLVQKAANEKNWVERWWEDLAYLSNRQPLIPHCSMMGVGLTEELLNTTQSGADGDISNISVYMHYLIEFWRLLRSERFKQTQGGDGTVFSMMQFRRLFNTVRVPGKHKDSLISYFKTESEGACPTHVIVLRAGRIFQVEALDANGAAISPADWEAKFTQIRNACNHHVGSGVGILGSDDRTIWAANREHLGSLSFENRNALHMIETAICVITLDTDTPFSGSEIGTKSLAGDFLNRWADKSLGVIGFENGSIGGYCDHTAFDGMISVAAMYYVFLSMQQSLVVPTRHVNNQLALPIEINFHIDEKIREEIKQAKFNREESKKMVLVVAEKYIGYGKQLIQKQRLHPDSFVQMALQLAYFRLHHKPAPTYETATTRAFYNGRTETVRSCTVESMAWVTAMLNKDTSVEVKRDLLRRAVAKHDELMKDGRENAGCDRHLFGLQCIAAEEGLDMPEIYSDLAYAKSGGGGNFVLSTSLVGYTPIGGGVAPMCLNGYGCFYNINPNYLQFSIAAWRASPETSASKFFACIVQSLEDMMGVLGPAPSRL